MKYLIIKDTNIVSSERSKGINRELFKISRPSPDVNDVTLYQYEEIKHPITDERAIVFNDTDEIQVGQNPNVTKLKELVSANATQIEQDQLEQYIISQQGNRIVFKNIIPSSVTIKTFEEMELDGWFTINEDI